jgi:hypothetical protein
VLMLCTCTPYYNASISWCYCTRDSFIYSTTVAPSVVTEIWHCLLVCGYFAVSLFRLWYKSI